jgi:hypothetical protein
MRGDAININAQAAEAGYDANQIIIVLKMLIKRVVTNNNTRPSKSSFN